MCQKGFQEAQKTNSDLVNHIQKNISDGGYGGKDWIETMKESFGVGKSPKELTSKMVL